MHGRQFNFWMAFADIVLMLFVTVLVLAARSQTKQTELEKQKADLEDQVENLFACRGAENLLDGFSACIEREFGRKTEERNPCAVTVGEDLIRFETAEAEPLDPEAAHKVVRCLYDTTTKFAAASPDAFEQVQTIHINGFTDCAGELKNNSDLGARRGLRLYSMLLEELAADAQWPADSKPREALLAKFAIRSFGETRPLANSQCAEQGEDGDDRRVTISIDMRPERGGAGETPAKRGT